MIPQPQPHPSVSLWHGDALEVLQRLPDGSVDAVVTDPPYGLEFMGREWDRFTPTGFTDGAVREPAPSWSRSAWQNKRCVRCGHIASGGSPCRCDEPVWTIETGKSNAAAHAYQAWCQAWAAHCLRVLKPGGHLLAFGGTRTYHRLTCAIEDAGFEIRDEIAWLYGSGFPKSLDVSKAIDRAAGAQRQMIGPAPYSRGRAGQSYSETRRVSYDYDPQPVTAPATDDAARWSGWGTALKPAHEPIVVARKPLAGTVAANVLAHGTGALNIDGCRVEYEQGGTLASNPSLRTHINGGNGGEIISHEDERRVVIPNAAGRWPSNVVFDEYAAAELGEPARYFPTFTYQAKAPAKERPKVDGVAHPTVKPLELMRWLVRLVAPPGGLVLDPFAGSGTTAQACITEGFRCVAIEREQTYLPLIANRLQQTDD